MSSVRKLDRAFFRRDSRVVAPELLNKLLCRGRHDAPLRVGRIVEVEAYAGAEDPGSHGYRGRTLRTVTMFGPPGHLYVYFIYGIALVLQRGVRRRRRRVGDSDSCPGPYRRRPRRCGPRGRAARHDRDLCSGPAKLCQALDITGDDDGSDLVTGSGGIHIADDGTPPPEEPPQSRRIGLSAGADLPWRWVVPGRPQPFAPGMRTVPRAPNPHPGPLRPSPFGKGGAGGGFSAGTAEQPENPPSVPPFSKGGRQNPPSVPPFSKGGRQNPPSVPPFSKGGRGLTS